MNAREMDRFIAHCDKYLEQTDCTVLHPTVEGMPHIDILLYAPNEKYPFWKLITMGASDYKMPKLPVSLGNRNEYMMFVNSDEDLNDKNVLTWYHNTLMGIAHYPRAAKIAVTYAHSIEWGEDEDNQSDMVAAFLEMPQMIENPDVLRCRLGLFKQVICLQVITLTRAETDKLLKMGPQEFSSFLYPEDESAPHYLCERFRTENF